jgi:hypothetical protein
MAITDGIFKTRKLFFGTKTRRLIRTLVFSGAGTKDVVFFRESGSNQSAWIDYLGININQEFNFITIENKSSHRGSYCLETDLSDSITVDLSGNDSVSIFEAQGSAGSIIEENNIYSPIRRLRVYLAGAGNVEISLYLK